MSPSRASRLRRLEDAFADPPVAARERDAPRARELHDAEVVEQLEQRRELLRIARRLDRERLVGGIGHAHAEDLAVLEDPRTHVAFGAHLDEHQLTLDGLVGLVLEDLDHVDQLVQLLRDLLERLLVDVDDDRHPRETLVLRRADGE